MQQGAGLIHTGPAVFGELRPLREELQQAAMLSRFVHPLRRRAGIAAVMRTQHRSAQCIIRRTAGAPGELLANSHAEKGFRCGMQGKRTGQCGVCTVQIIRSERAQPQMGVYGPAPVSSAGGACL